MVHAVDTDSASNSIENKLHILRGDGDLSVGAGVVQEDNVFCLGFHTLPQ